MLTGGFSKAFLTFSCLKQESSLVPSTGYGFRFVIFLHAFDVMTFAKPVIFKAHHSKKFRRYEKTKAISSKGAHMNFLVLGIKPY